MHSAKLLLAAAILFSSISLSAQTDSLKFNSQIQFQLVEGYSVSYLAKLDSSTGLRFKVDLVLIGSSRSGEYNLKYFGNSSNGFLSEVQNNNSDRSVSSQYFQLNLNYLWFSNLTKDIRLYMGGGPMLSFGRSSSEEHSDRGATSYYPASKSFNEYSSKSFGVGFKGSVGIECGITKRLSLLTEFNLEGTYNWDNWKSRNESLEPGSSATETTDDGHSWNYALSNLRIGIAYNF